MDEQVALLRRAKAGDREASGRMVEENAGLIWAVARRFFGRGCDPDDLYQLGCVGFLKAIDGFDEDYGTRFSTYAVPKISGEIRRFLRDDGAVKVSRTLKEQYAALRSARAQLEQSHGRAPTVLELAAYTGLSAEEIALAEGAAEPAASLQQELGADGFSLEQTLSDPEGEERLLEHVALSQALDTLPDNERMTLYLRFWHGMTQSDASRVLGVSQVQVSRLEKRAVGHLREFLRD